MHDLTPDEFERAGLPVTADDCVFPAEPIIGTCVGCYGCWISTPGECVIDDRGKGFAALITKHDEFIVISRLVFGGFSSPVKAVLDRSIGHMLPFFRVVKGETHHDKRSKNKFSFRCVFYCDDMEDRDKETATALVAANALNLAAEGHSVEFFPSSQLFGFEL